MSKEDSMKGIATSEKGESTKAYDDLRKWGLLKIKRTGYGEQVSIFPNMLKDVQALLNPNPQTIVKDRPPLEYSIDPEFDVNPFLTTYADKVINGKRGKYSYHKSLAGLERMKAYVSVEGEKVYIINLGSFYEKDSLLAKAVTRINEKFDNKAFAKAEMYDLGRDIVGNKQPVKAILDVLVFYKYLIDLKEGYYKRTTKKLPRSGLEDFSSE